MTARVLPLLALAGLSLTASGCSWMKKFQQKPKVTLQKVDVVGVDFQAARLRADLEVENRIPAVVKLLKVDWGVKIEDAKLVSGTLAQAIEVPANGTVPVQVPFTLTFEDLYRISQKYKDQDEAPYRLEGSLSLDTPIGPVSLPFHHVGKVPVLKIPQVDLAKADVKGVNFTGADVRFKFNVKNPNNIALDVQSLDYALAIAGTKILDGALPGALSVPPKGQGTFDADVRISFAQASAAAQAIANKSSASYSLTGNLAAKTPWGTVSSPYAKNGTVKISQ